MDYLNIQPLINLPILVSLKSCGELWLLENKSPEDFELTPQKLKTAYLFSTGFIEKYYSQLDLNQFFKTQGILASDQKDQTKNKDDCERD